MAPPDEGIPAHFSHGLVLLDGTPRRGGTSAIYIFMAPLTVFNEAPKLKSFAPLALKNAILWLNWPSFNEGVPAHFSHGMVLLDGTP